MTFQTPSPVMSAYRGKHLNSVGREFRVAFKKNLLWAFSFLGALDASFLSQLGLDDSESDDDHGSKD